MYIDVKYTNLCISFISCAHMCTQRFCAFRATSVSCVSAPRDSWTWIVQRISAETFRKFSALLCNQISPVFPLRFRSPSKLSGSFPFHVQRHPIKGLSHLLIWWGVALSCRSAGASGPHNNELGDNSWHIEGHNEWTAFACPSYKQSLTRFRHYGT